MSTPSNELVQLADRALRLKLRADQAAADYKEAQEDLYTKLEAEKLLNPDTKGLGDIVRVKIVPNRYFDLATAESLVTKKVITESTVKVVDPKILKTKMTGEQIEKAMLSHPRAFKLSVEIAD